MKTTRHHQAQKIFRAGAEGHSQAELARSLRNRVRHHAVQSNRGEKERHRAEDRDERDSKALAVTDFINLVLEPICDQRRQIRVERVDLARERIHHRARRFTRPNQQSVLNAKILPQRYVKERHWRLNLGAVIGVLGDANDLHPFVFYFHARTERILA